VLARLAYLAVAHAFAALRLPPMTNHEKDVEILALRHQLTVLQRQLGGQRPHLQPEDRAILAALLKPLPRPTLRRLQLLISPDTVSRWHPNLVNQHHSRASANRGPGRPRTLASIRRLVLRMAAENPCWGYRRIHAELTLPGITVAPSTVWEILRAEGIDPAPHRATMTWTAFLRSQAEAILAMDFIETVTVSGQRQYILPAIHHTNRRVRMLGTTAHPTHAWVIQTVRNLVMDAESTEQSAVRSLTRDRDTKYPALIDEILCDAGIITALTGVQMPRMNAIMERWVKTLRAELLDRTLIWHETHLRHTLHQYERHYNSHRTHRALASAAPLQKLPHPLKPDQSHHLALYRHRQSRRRDPRVPDRRLTCADRVFGTHNRAERQGPSRRFTPVDAGIGKDGALPHKTNASILTSPKCRVGFPHAAAYKAPPHHAIISISQKRAGVRHARNDRLRAHSATLFRVPSRVTRMIHFPSQCLAGDRLGAGESPQRSLEGNHST
jgi:transposase